MGLHLFRRILITNQIAAAADTAADTGHTLDKVAWKHAFVRSGQRLFALVDTVTDYRFKLKILDIQFL